jgi:hypothetical protein
MHKTLIAALASLTVLTCAPAFSANSQQTKMTTCNADATSKGLTGDDRKAYMKTCLSAAPPAATGNSQQQKMKTCNADANTQGLKGDDRKTYMKTCLSSSS